MEQRQQGGGACGGAGPGRVRGGANPKSRASTLVAFLGVTSGCDRNFCLAGLDVTGIFFQLLRDGLHCGIFPVPSGRDMSVPRPSPPDGVSAGPPESVGAGELTPGT